jgi:hypothetical protein
MTAGLSLIFVRVLIFIYIHQFANVRWNGRFSDTFWMTNGVRQGAILSAIFYCIYMNDLFKILRRSKFGCWVFSKWSLSVKGMPTAMISSSAQIQIQENVRLNV